MGSSGGASALRQRYRSYCYEGSPMKLFHGKGRDISEEPKHQEYGRGSKEEEEAMAELSSVFMADGDDGNASSECPGG